MHFLLLLAAVICGLVLIGIVVILFLRARDVNPPESDTTGELWTLAGPDLDVTIVVPYYNPGPRLVETLQTIINLLRSLDTRFELIAVSDGSSVESQESLRHLAPEVVRHVALPVNSGKGQALRVGLAMGRGQYLGFIDADGDVNPKVLEPFISIARSYNADVVLGSKRHPLSEVEYPTIRRVYSWGYQQLIRMLFRLNIRDTQTGVKLIRRDVLARTLPRTVEKRFAFDLELFVVARYLGYTKFFEAPVKIEEQITSTISLAAVRGTFLDTLAIFYRLHFLKYYERAHDKPIPSIEVED